VATQGWWIQRPV